ncbi:MAG: hypothetical protein ACRDJN_03495, partial [Chloroflexota bacterium]
MALAPEVRWLWNGDLQPQALRRQLGELRARGYRAVAIWPWAGLEVPYLSMEYLERLPVACKAAADLGLTLWLAADLNWPSGTVGGRLLVEYPEYAQRALVCTSRWVRGRTPVEAPWLGEGEQLVAAVAVDTGGQRRDLAGQLSDRGRAVREPRLAQFAGHQAAWEAELWESSVRLPAGTWFVANATVVPVRPLLASALGTRWSSGAPGTLDVLNPMAARAFVELALEPIAAAVESWLGGVVAGLVDVPPDTLCPHPMLPPDGWRLDVLPWFPDLPDQFRERTGTRFAQQLPYLLASLHDHDGASSGDSLATITELAAERRAVAYDEPLDGWCRDQRLARVTLAPADLPAVPYTLKGERKRSLPLGALAPAMAAPTGGSEDGSGNAAGVTPDASWAIVDVLQPVWEWRPRSANLHPLDAWGSQGPPDAGDERRRLRARFEADFLPVDLGILYETGVVEALTLNGARLNLTAARRPEPDEVELADEAARLVSLRGAAPARRGTNVLEATVRTPDSERIA